MWSSFNFQGSLRSPVVGKENRACGSWLEGREPGRGGYRKGEKVGVETPCLWSQDDLTSTADRNGGVTLELGSGQLAWTGWSCSGSPAPSQLQAFEQQGLPQALSYVEEAPGERNVGSQPGFQAGGLTADNWR